MLIVANLRRTQLRNELNELEGVNDSTNSENISLRRDKVLLTDEVATLNGKVGVYLVSLDPPGGRGSEERVLTTAQIAGENISLRRDKVLHNDEAATLNGKVGKELESLDSRGGGEGEGYQRQHK